MNMETELEDLYERWLMDKFSDEISNKDDLINKSCEGFMRDEFNDEVRANL